MARFNVVVEDGKVVIGANYSRERIEPSDISDFIRVLNAAAIFAEVNADVPKESAAESANDTSEHAAKPEAAE